MPAPKGTMLILSQVYVPDPASVGQHLADAAAEMVRRGWRVVVLTSARGYDDPTRKYPAREVIDGVEVRRLPLSSFGKRSIPVRLAAQALFLAQAIVRGVFVRGMRMVLVSTSPPMASVAALIVSALRGAPVKFWAMDLNPDQMIALGKISEKSVSARVFEMFNRAILRRSSDVVALDRFMAGRLNRKVSVGEKMHVMPPWPHEDHLDVVEHAKNPFRERHGLQGKYVVMYSGNHAPSNPLTTIIEAAKRLRDDARFVFLFIGAGLAKKDVEAAIAAGCTNVRSLPYQPMSELRYSLSAADAHVVTIGNEVVGIVHPCKVYGAMAVARPLLFAGPRPSHVSDLIDEHKVGWQVEHGDVEGCVRALKEMADQPREEWAAMGRRAQEAVARSLSKASLCGRFCDVLERGLARTEPAGGGVASGASAAKNAAS